MTADFRVAVVGLGWWGRTVAAALRGSDVVSVVLGADPSAAGRTAGEELGLRMANSLEEVLQAPDIDGVVLCTPHTAHAGQIVAAARAGKHVFCEKPLCTSGEEAEWALGEVTEHGVTLGVGHERRFEPPVVDLLRRVRAGEFGTPLVFEGAFSQDKFLGMDPGNWRLSPEVSPVGPLSATGVHLVDLSVALLGAPTQVWARMATLGSELPNGDTLTVTIGFESGATAVLTSVLATPFFGRAMLVGSSGWVEVRDRNHPEEPQGWDVVRKRRGAPAVTEFVPPHPAVRDNIEQWAKAALGGSPYPIPVEEMRWTVRTYEAVVRSVASGRVESP